MSRIAIVCAYNTRNCGMYSVDRAAGHVFDALGLPYELCVTQDRTRVGALRFRLIRTPEELRGYRAVVYWGDFLNNPMWGALHYAPKERGRHRVEADAEALENWRRLYLRAGEALPDRVPIHSFGGCYIGMTPFVRDAASASAMDYFLRRAGRVVARDPASLGELQAVPAAADRPPLLGFDCASLMRTRGPARWRGPWFAYSFGRGLTEAQGRTLVRAVERASGLRGVSVPWLTVGAGRRFRHARFLANLAWMRHARFCLTDTYHFAINAMSQGTLPVCVLRDEGPPPLTALNELKKQALYGMVGLQPALLRIAGQPQGPVEPPVLQETAEAAARVWRERGRDLDWRAGFLERQAALREQVRGALA